MSNSVFKEYDPLEPNRPGETYNPSHLEHIAKNSNGTIHFAPFTNQEEMLSHAAAVVGIGPSNYEPGGQNDAMAQIYALISYFAWTGGYVDKVEELRLKSQGATHDHGNGYLHHNNYDDFKNGLRKTHLLLSYLKKNPEEYNNNVKRIMLESRSDLSIEKMANAYSKYYDTIIKSIV